MRQELGVKKVIDYKYDSEEEAQEHAKQMVRDGWKIMSNSHVFVKYFRRFYKEIPNGVFL